MAHGERELKDTGRRHEEERGVGGLKSQEGKGDSQ